MSITPDTTKTNTEMLWLTAGQTKKAIMHAHYWCKTNTEMLWLTAGQTKKAIMHAHYWCPHQSLNMQSNCSCLGQLECEYHVIKLEWSTHTVSWTRGSLIVDTVLGSVRRVYSWGLLNPVGTSKTVSYLDYKPPLVQSNRTWLCAHSSFTTDTHIQLHKLNYRLWLTRQSWLHGKVSRHSVHVCTTVRLCPITAVVSTFATHEHKHETTMYL